MQAPQVQPQVSEPDAKTKAWAAQNEWFGNDSEMTGYAFGVHEKLVKGGINPQSQADEYYRAIDDSMRQRFPDKFGGKNLRKKHLPVKLVPWLPPLTECKKTTQRCN